MTDQPLVSVCIPSYNHAQYLPYCIESVLAQTYPNLELIIVDDASKDNSLKIAREYAARHPNLIRVHTHPNGENRGVSATSNLAFDLSKGKYWTGLPSDDALYKNRIEKQVNFLEANEKIALVYSYGDYIDAQGNKLPGVFGEDITKTADPLMTLLYRNVIPGMTVLARREAVAAAGYQHRDIIYGDWEYWLRFAARYELGFIPESLVEYRVHDYNTSLGIPDWSQCENNRQVYIKLQTDVEIKKSKIGEPKYQDFIRECLAQTARLEARLLVDEYFAALGEGNLTQAKKFIKQAYRLSPRVVLQPKRLAAVLKHALLNGLSPRGGKP